MFCIEEDVVEPVVAVPRQREKVPKPVSQTTRPEGKQAQPTEDLSATTEDEIQAGEEATTTSAPSGQERIKMDGLMLSGVLFISVALANLF